MVSEPQHGALNTVTALLSLLASSLLPKDLDSRLRVGNNGDEKWKRSIGRHMRSSILRSEIEGRLKILPDLTVDGDNCSSRHVEQPDFGKGALHSEDLHAWDGSHRDGDPSVDVVDVPSSKILGYLGMAEDCMGLGNLTCACYSPENRTTTATTSRSTR
jgi:hypothetical protein